MYKVLLKRSKKETPTQLCQLILFWLGLVDLVSCDDNRKTLILMTSRTAGVSSNASTTVLGVRLSDLIIGKRGNPHFQLAAIGLELRS